MEGCERPFIAKGYCKPHYRAWKTHGTPLGATKCGMLLTDIHAQATDEGKHCTDCGKFKSWTDFPTSPRNFGGVHAKCRWCTNDHYWAYRQTSHRHQTWLKDHLQQSHVKEAARRRYIERKYGEGAWEIEQRRLAGEPCDACGQTLDPRSMNIDHCHTTGRVRGLLCRPCNYALGHTADDVDRLEQLIAYLRR